MAPSSLWFEPLITTLVAASIFYVAIENIIGTRLGRRTVVGYAAGGVFGFAVAFALGKTLQFAGSHSLMSVLSFDAGVAVGQIFTLALMVPALEILFQFVVEERMGTIILSALAAHAAWHWMADHYSDLRRFPLHWPVVDALFLADAMRWTMIAVVLAAAIWLAGILRPLVTRSAVKREHRESPVASR
jgi:hypothetical protein